MFLAINISLSPIVPLKGIHPHHIAHLVGHLTRDSGRPGSNPGLVRHYLSHNVIFGANSNPGTDRIIPAKRKKIGLIFEGEII